MNLAILSTSKKILVALSGGKDSSVALHLTQEYCKKYNKIFHGAVIINHNLRPESYIEAINVAQYWTKKGISVDIIDWNNPIHNQKKAREFRLMQLSLYAIRNNIDTIVLGHNLQDKLETYLMRLEKQSTFWGLASIAPITYIYGIKFVRPLLHTHQDFIINYVKEKNIKIFEDSSNMTLKYTRNRIRQQLLKINTREIIELINQNIQLRRNYGILIENWIKLHLIIINRFKYKFLWNRLPKDKIIAALILSHIAWNIKGRSVDSHELFFPYLEDKKRSFHVNDCCFKYQGDYCMVQEIIPNIVIKNEKLWHYKILIIDLLGQQRHFQFINLVMPYFKFNNQIIDFSCKDYITENSFLIKYIDRNFYSVY